MKSWRTTSIVGLALGLLLAACLPSPDLTPTEIATAPTEIATAPTQIVTDATITYPSNGAEVEREEMVRGTSQEVPAGHVIWIVVFPHAASRYYPQDRQADIEAKGDWTSKAYIGVEENVGEGFDIIAVIADEAGQGVFRRYFEDARKNNDWRGLEQLPEGAVIYNRVTVTRK